MPDSHIFAYRLERQISRLIVCISISFFRRHPKTLINTGYTFDEFLDDNTIAHFNTSVRPQDVITVVNDIQTINNQIKFHGVPWSPVRTYECRSLPLLDVLLAILDERQRKHQWWQYVGCVFECPYVSLYPSLIRFGDTLLMVVSP